MNRAGLLGSCLLDGTAHVEVQDLGAIPGKGKGGYFPTYKMPKFFILIRY